MNIIKNKINFSNFWVRNGLIIVLLSILSNHLIDSQNFPLNKDYKFPLFPISVSIIASCLIIIIAKYNFIYFEKKYFTKKISTKILLRFLFSTLGYITLLYIFLYFSLNGLINGTKSYSVYNLLTGLLISLMICTIGITLLFSTDIYKIYKLKSIKGTLKVKQGGKLTLVKYNEIAFIYSENKIVYIVKTNETRIITDFTLNEVENKISEHNFFRANRQIVLHLRSIEQVQSIENGKLSVLLKPAIFNQEPFQITISKYKKQSFMDWLNNKS